MSRKDKPSFDIEMPPPINVPPPPAPSADRFALLVGGQRQQAAVVDVPSVPSTKPEAPSCDAVEPNGNGARIYSRKRDGASLRRLHVRLPLELERQLKRFCLDTEKAAAAVVVDALRAYLRSGAVK